MKYLSSISILVLAIVLPTQSQGQQKENVILKAMKDELKRSMEMRDTGYDKPFFISYGIADLRNFTAYGSLGAIIQSGESKSRSKSVRVLVGSYEFNDESLDNNTFSDATGREIDMPQEDDYFGIRRSLWTSTDVVYKGAAQKFKKHQNTLKEQQKKLSELPHRTFAKVPLLVKDALPPAFTFDKKVIEDYTKKLSAVFKSYTALESANVIVSVTGGDNYFVNSEGTVVIKPFRMAVLQCHVQSKTSVGEPLIESLVCYGDDFTDLPPLAEAMLQAKKICEKLTALQKTESLDEDYSGPVLFIGPAVADLFASTLFSYRETLMASDAIRSTADFRPEATGLLDGRIGKVVIDNSISVRAIPTQNTFEKQHLIGSYDVDDEGVVPAKELQLIEKGILRNLLNDRSLVKEDQKANGHASGPGVIEVTSSKQFTESALKQSLIDAAKSDGLPFALMIRKSGNMGESIPEVWKVDTATGAESLVRSAQLNPITLKELRRIAGTSPVMGAHTVQAGEGALASMICPAALLLESVDVTPLKLPYPEQDITYVPSPLLNLN